MTDERQGGGGKLWIDHVHQLIRLLAEAREIPVWRPERAHHLMSGFARIVGAVLAEVVLEVEAAPDGMAELLVRDVVLLAVEEVRGHTVATCTSQIELRIDVSSCA